ncbi:MAG: VCBS repeat-containing protein [Planctomyces sp.]|nr:VCBS repeat-containing protein [Planctomyces sp.]
MPVARLLALVALCSTASAAVPRFDTIVLDDDLCNVAVYAVALADVDGDGLADVVAVTENRVLWYRNPDWQRRTIIADATERDNVCIAPHDIDGDGQVDFAIGAGWLNGKNLGTIQWVSRGETLDAPWRVHPIGAISWTHRMRFADVLGRGRPQLVVSPLNATDGRAGVQLTAFAIPADPMSAPWERTVLDESMNRMHNHWHLAVDEGQDGTLTASEEGVFWLAAPDAEPLRIGAGAEGARAEDRGAGEIKSGRLPDGRRLLATVEPMHGHMAVVYLLPPGDAPAAARQRIVLDDTLRQGHGVWVADFTGNGVDDVVVGHREPGTGTLRGPGVYLYEAVSAEGLEWRKHAIDDGGMAAEDLVAGDLNGDGRIDIVAGGRATKNLKLYLNRGPDGDDR